MTSLKTTRPVLPVQSIDDIRAIEAAPYETRVTARNLFDLFRATALHGPDRMALTVLRSPDPADIGTAQTHAQLLRSITRAANMFRALGLEQGRGVAAFLAPTLPRLPELVLGAQVAGVASTLNYLLSGEAIIDLLNAEKATILVIPAAHLDPTCFERGLEVIAAVPSLEHVLVIGADEAPAPARASGTGPKPAPTPAPTHTPTHTSASRPETAPGQLAGKSGQTAPESAPAPAPERALTPLRVALRGHCDSALSFDPSDDPDTVCALFHTGGTTGRPKLVPLTHGNQIHAAFGFAQVIGFDETDTVINGFPLFHVGGTMTVGLSVLAAGGHVVVPSPYALRPPPVVQSYWRLAEAFKATVISGVPTSIAALTTTWSAAQDLSALRMALTGGAALPETVAERFEQTVGIGLYETYGMTETAAAIAFTPRLTAPHRGSVGLRAPYAQTRILRTDGSAAPCAAGEAGSVQLRGPQVFRGYVDPAHNSGVLTDDGWLTTGDIGYLTADERLVLTGREKDLIVRSGHNIDPGAIEEVANRHPDVEISAAVGMPDQYAGEVPALFVVAKAGADINLAALHEMLERDLHEPPARPKRIIVIDSLPVTAVGKLFKPALRERAILEKLDMEVVRHCGAGARVKAAVTADPQGRPQIDAAVSGADEAALNALRAALAPLPQSYVIRDAAPRVGLTIEDGIALVTLDHPDSLNAASKAMMQALEQRLHDLAAAAPLRAVILTGAGRAFCAGGDLVEFKAELDQSGAALIDTLAYNQRVISMIEALPVPVIGAVNGIAIAGGLERRLCCDISVASDGARLGDGHARYGIVPAGGASLRLAEKIGPNRAAQLFYTAQTIDAQTALQWGLVNDIATPEALLETARRIACDIARCSPEVVRKIKTLIGPRQNGAERQARLDAEIDAFRAHLQGRDLAQGLRAFTAKTAPLYADPPRPAKDDTAG